MQISFVIDICLMRIYISAMFAILMYIFQNTQILERGNWPPVHRPLWWDWHPSIRESDNISRQLWEGFIHIFTRGQFWPSGIVVPASVCLCVFVRVCARQPRACPRHKSSRIQARTTKFGQKVQNNLVKVPIVLGGDWLWPPRSNLTWKAKFTPFWACQRHNSPYIHARTTKFGQNMQTNLLMVPIVLEGD